MAFNPQDLDQAMAGVANGRTKEDDKALQGANVQSQPSPPPQGAGQSDPTATDAINQVLGHVQQVARDSIPGASGYNPESGDTSGTRAGRLIDYTVNGRPGEIRQAVGQYDSQYAQDANQRQQNLTDLQSRNAPQFGAAQGQAANAGLAGQAQTGIVDKGYIGGDSQYRQNQNNFINALDAASNGQGPSLANAQLQAATDRNLKQLAGSAASQRGVPAALAGRNLMNAQSDVNQQAAQQSAQNRIQEQLNARAQLGNAIGQGLGYDTNLRGQNIGVAGQQAQMNQQNSQFNAGQGNQQNQFNAGLQQQTNQQNAGLQEQQTLANQQAQVQNQQQIADLTSKYMAMGLSQTEAQQKATLDAQQLITQGDNAALAGQVGTFAADAGSPSLAGTLAGTIPAAAGGGSAAVVSKLLAKGGNVEPGITLVGEEGPELLITEGNGFVIPNPKTDPNKPTDEILKHKGVQDFLQYLDKNHIVSRAGGGILGEISKTFNMVGNPVYKDLESNPMFSTVGGSSIGTGQGEQMKQEIAGIQNPMAMSDKKNKKNIKEAKSTVGDFLDHLDGKSYEYKDTSLPGTAPGRHLGVMAQTLEKSGPIGEALVIDSPQGKMVDYGAGFGALLASMAEINKRQGELEDMLKKRGKK